MPVVAAIKTLMGCGGSSPLVVMIVNWKLPRGVHTVQASGQHMYQSMPKLTSPLEDTTQMTSITVKMATYFFAVAALSS